MAAMEDEEMEKKVQQYLHRKGFRLTELALHEERSRLRHLRRRAYPVGLPVPLPWPTLGRSSRPGQ
jgi:hypothetical protein